jgi:hypothetical protein
LTLVERRVTIEALSSNSKGASMNGTTVKVFIGIVVIAAIFYLRTQRQGDDSSDIRQQMAEVLAAMPEYEADKQLIDEMADTAHSGAFTKAYSSGRRRSTFDETEYLDAFFKSMIDQANFRNRRDLGGAIQVLQGEIMAASEDDGGETP